MEPISRRTMLRMSSGGAVGASGLAGLGLLTPAAASARVQVRLQAAVVELGHTLTLRIAEDLKQGRRIQVSDDTGLRWTRVAASQRAQTWTATPTTAGRGTVRVVTTRADGRVFRDRVSYEVIEALQPTPTGNVHVGMSTPATVWDERVAAVGVGLTARRIFADLADGPTSQRRLVEQAHADGMLPVISYKVGGDVAGAVSGAFNAVAGQAAAELAAYGLPTAVTFWHEPHGDLSGEEYAAASRQIMPYFKRGELRVGPLLNGWLLDNQQDVFASYCPDDLFAIWDWVGIDTYESGTLAAPGPRKPANRIPALSAHVRSRGFDLPLGIGEYNGFSAESIAAAGEALFSTPNVWFGCLWNADGDRAVELSGDRLSAFQQTVADSRSASPRVG